MQRPKGPPAVVFRLGNLTKGRKSRFANTTMPVSKSACHPPTSANHLKVEAVFAPGTVNPSPTPMPMPGKPVPDTIGAAARVGLTPLTTRPVKTAKPAVRKVTRTLVCTPAIR